MTQLTQKKDDIKELQNEELQNEYIEVFKLIRLKSEIKLESEKIDIDTALVRTFWEGLTLLCDQRRYSTHGFRRYTRKWRI